MSHELYIGPDGTFPLHPGDIQREHPNWEIGVDLPPDWRHVVNVAKPEDILIYPEFADSNNRKKFSVVCKANCSHDSPLISARKFAV